MRNQRRGFTLIELLVVIGLIALLISLLMPALQKARRAAESTACAANLHQIAMAFQSYLNDNRGLCFWKGEEINRDGMDWYTWGGRETENFNHDQWGMFNRSPRPLNRYIKNPNVFRCIRDDGNSWWVETGSNFEWTGNSYNFNANGAPQGDLKGGIAGMHITKVGVSSRVVVFCDAGLYLYGNWHQQWKGNICLADSHIVFVNLPPIEGGEYDWVAHNAANE